MRITKTCVLVSLACAFALAANGQRQGVLKLTVVEGEGAFNDIRRSVAQSPVVEVRDENNRLVAGAKVTFTLPYSGPGATFADGGRTYSTVTGQDGRAAAAAMKPNRLEGRYNVKVTAATEGREGSTVVSQSNTAAGGTMAAGGGGKKKYILLGLLGGGAAVGVVAATRGGGNGSGGGTAPAATVLSPGPISVGGPR